LNPRVRPSALIGPSDLAGQIAGDALTVTDPGTDKTNATITASDGFFKGTFQYPGQKKPTDFDGVLFQDQTPGAGFFVGPDGSGTVNLSP
jgi:hypothetical protein